MKNETNNQKMITLKSIIFFIVVIAVICLVTLYVCDESVREMIDTYIFRKEISQEHATSIDLLGESDQYVYAYDKYIVTLRKGTMDAYTGSGNKSFSIDVTIGNPIFSSNGRFLCLGENNGQKIYLISGENIVWQNEVEGNISKINVNKNGYVSVIVKGTSYKTVVITFNSEGKELFKTYLSSTDAVVTDISSDNKYLAIAEINSSGSIIQSNVKIISMQKAKEDPTNSIVYTYKADSNQLITNIKYQDKGILVCMYNNQIILIDNQKEKDLISVKENISFMDINLKDAVITIQDEKKGLLNNHSQVIIKNIHNQTESLYTIENLINSLYTSWENIALNIGSEIHFIKTNGWVQKIYKANQEITNIVIGDNIAGVVYRDKIDIINL